MHFDEPHILRRLTVVSSNATMPRQLSCRIQRFTLVGHRLGLSGSALTDAARKRRRPLFILISSLAVAISKEQDTVSAGFGQPRKLSVWVHGVLGAGVKKGCVHPGVDNS
jgi:hypothetical protein